MFNRIFLSTIAAAILTGCAVAPSAPPPCSAPGVTGERVDEAHSVFGIGLGQPLAMPECPKYGTGSSASYGVPNQLCWKRALNLQSCSAPKNGYVNIAFPILKLPVWVSGSDISARVINGRVEGLVITTTGLRSQHFTFDDLSAKYGAPREKEVVAMKNLVGDTFEAIISFWGTNDVLVTFFGALRTADAGKVQIATQAGEAALEADLDRLLKAPTPL